MKHFSWTKKKAALTLIIAATTTLILQNNQTTQAALLNPHPGLIAWWNFDEGSGTIAGDMSGNGNIGTLNGATWVSGKYETALIFDGATNYVNVPTTNMLTGSLS